MCAKEQKQVEQENRGYTRKKQIKSSLVFFHSFFLLSSSMALGFATVLLGVYVGIVHGNQGIYIRKDSVTLDMIKSLSANTSVSFEHYEDSYTVSVTIFSGGMDIVQDTTHDTTQKNCQHVNTQEEATTKELVRVR
jgi:hypothetical protein